MLATIRLNDESNLVLIAKFLLGFADISNIYTQDFKDFVIEWQEDNELTADGIIGPKTWTAIAAQLPTCSTKKNKKSTYTYAVQMLVGGIEVDGSYGPITKQAVAAYQAAQGLTADGACGPKTWNALIVGKTSSSSTIPSTPSGEGQTISGGKVLNNCVKYLQWDSKWKNIKYSTHTSSQTIGNSGCGTTSMAMILATWYNKKITPVEMSALAVEKGYRTYNSGTAWGFFKYIFKHYECFSKYIETSSVETLKVGIREGALAVCSMNSNDGGFWTNGGMALKMAS